jgi:inward rectifier potassium channel
MAILRRINSNAATDKTTGFGTNSAMYGGRLINNNGRPNIRKTGIGFWDGLSWYHTLIEMPRWKFLMFIFIYFLIINLLFAIVYFTVGVEHLNGVSANTTVQKFIEAYFFSAQTFTTVGYGRISPAGYLTSFIAALEAFTGLLFFALATGLFYARFSRPQAFLRFSHNALIAPFNNDVALMLRMAPFKNNYLTDAEVKLTVAMIVEEDGRQVNRFFPLELEYSKVNALSLSWTVVHPITTESPLIGLTEEDLHNLKAEVLVFVKAFDETFSNTVVARTSYTAAEIKWGAKFIPMYNRSANSKHTIISLDKLNEHEPVDITAALNAKKRQYSQ